MKKSLMVLAILIISGSLIFPQATSGKVKMRGEVIDEETGKPIEGVKVKLFSVRANSFHNVSPKTDIEGKWRSMYMRSGRWYLDFEKVGYGPRKIAVSYNFINGKYFCFFKGEKLDVLKIKMQKIQGPALEESIVKEIEEGNALLADKKVQEALNKFMEVLKKFKENEGIEIVNLYIGNCYSLLEKYEDAIKYFSMAVKKYPKHTGLILSIGNSYSNLKQTDKAMEWFQKLSYEDLTNTDTLYNIGINYYNRMKYNDAKKYFSRAVEFKEDFADAYYQLGMTYVALNKVPEALKALKKFVELDPDSPNFTTANEIIKAFSGQ
ncbi:MAG: tetratricopeptide repeat protein [Acidobacteriota bacterium]